MFNGEWLMVNGEWLYRIDEEFLLAVEHRDADEEQHEGYERTETKGAPRELSGSVGAVFEGLDDSRHGIEEHDLMQRRIRDITERIDDRRSVHP